MHINNSFNNHSQVVNPVVLEVNDNQWFKWYNFVHYKVILIVHFIYSAHVCLQIYNQLKKLDVA